MLYPARQPERAGKFFCSPRTAVLEFSGNGVDGELKRGSPESPRFNQSLMSNANRVQRAADPSAAGYPLQTMVPWRKAFPWLHPLERRRWGPSGRDRLGGTYRQMEFWGENPSAPQMSLAHPFFVQLPKVWES